jgi:hypothetical protein
LQFFVFLIIIFVGEIAVGVLIYFREAPYQVVKLGSLGFHLFSHRSSTELPWLPIHPHPPVFKVARAGKQTRDLFGCVYFLINLLLSHSGSAFSGVFLNYLT